MILLLGPTGSGKSVQGKMLANRHGWAWLSAGELLRATNDPKVMELMRQGKLVPDGLTNQVVFDELAKFPTSEEERKVILDGFPRVAVQAEALTKHETERLGREPVDIVIDIKMTKKEILARLKLRGRMEDSPEVIEDRLKLHDKETQPLKDYYEKNGVPIETVDGVGTVGEVHDRIETKLEQYKITGSF